MMKYLFMMIFMIPISLKKTYFWMIQVYFFILTFMFLISLSYNYLPLNLSYFLGVDLLSYLMILLSLWICSLMILASFKLLKMNFYFNLFLMTVLILMISLFLTFSSLNLFIFYLFFEVSLIPTLILILGWGYQPERLQAGIYLLFYTIFASLPMMISIFYIYSCTNSFDYNFLIYLDNEFLFFCLNLVFFIKLPMYFIHLWLPKAHVEAPISGSMILAGVMLKLGGYGLIRFMMIFTKLFNKFNYIFITLGILGGVFVSLICVRQSDMKSLIAYSSVAHMGLVLSGIMTLSYIGFCGSLVMMIAHGLSSSGLFCLANIVYERIYSRSFFVVKGLINLLPSLSLWWFLLSACNMASPPSLNLLGEIMLISSLVSWSSYSMVFLAFMSFFSACYSLYLYSFTQHGKFWSGFISFSLNDIREYLLLMLHWLPLNILILKGDFISLFIY